MTGDPAHPRGRDVIVVLGASGWLGEHVVAEALERASWAILAAGRDRSRLPHGPNVEPVELDVTTSDNEALLARVLAHRPRRVCVVDAVLDKRTTNTMRESVDHAQRFVAKLAADMSAAGVDVRVVVAGSTAAFASAPLSHAYGRAKADQLRRYASLPVDTLVVVLPTLTGRATAPASLLDRLLPSASRLTVTVCSVEAAARCVAACAELGTAAPGAELAAASRVVRLAELRGFARRRAAGPMSVLLLPVVLALRFTVGRASPTWARRSSHALLAAMPAHVRARVDHHGIVPFVHRAGAGGSLPRARDIRRAPAT